MRLISNEKNFKVRQDVAGVESCGCLGLDVCGFCGERSVERYICTRVGGHGGEHHAHAEAGKIFAKW